jgi:hypothetical protein
MWSSAQRSALVEAIGTMGDQYLDQFIGKQRKAEKLRAILEAKHKKEFGDWSLVSVKAILNGITWLEKGYRKWKKRMSHTHGKTGQGLTGEEIKEHPECRNLHGMPPLLEEVPS